MQILFTYAFDYFGSSATSVYHHLIITLSSPLEHLWEICQKLSHNGVARRALRLPTAKVLKK